MKKYFSKIFIALFAFALIGFAVPATSFSATGSDIADYAVGSGTKLTRGVVNASTGWVEVFRGIYEKTIKHDPVTGLIYGSLYGTGMTVVRTVSGAYEAGSFFFPTPKKFKSTISPEFVWEDLE